MRIPIAGCTKCRHKIYREEKNHKRHAYTDASGNNDDYYSHIKCPKHEIMLTKIIMETTCTDCGVKFQEARDFGRSTL